MKNTLIRNKSLTYDVVVVGSIGADAVECIFASTNGCEDVRVFAVDGY